ncbi:MAG: hypothetical protein GY801_48330 [bacterium]|nr:hypothetical protein [bacterium]
MGDKVGIEVSEILTIEWAKFYRDSKSGNFQLRTSDANTEILLLVPGVHFDVWR